MPFVGTVPAIKPACAASQTKRVSVLGTEATVKREYTRALIRDFAQGCDVTLVGSARLAALAEDALRGEPVDDAAIAAEIAPCFIDEGARRTDTSCSPARTTRCCSIAWSASRPGRWRWIDPAPAIARRVVDLLGPAAGAGVQPAAGPGRCSPPARPPPPSPARAGFGRGPGGFGIAEMGGRRLRFDRDAGFPPRTARPAGSMARAAFRDPRFWPWR